MNQIQRTYIKIIIPLYVAIIFSFFTMVKTYDSQIIWKEAASTVLFIIVLALTGVAIHSLNKKIKATRKL